MGTWQVGAPHVPGVCADQWCLKLELDDPARGTVVIAYERLKNPPHCPEAIVVEDIGLLMLDRVVSTWVLFEKQKLEYSGHATGSPSSSLKNRPDMTEVITNRVS